MSRKNDVNEMMERLARLNERAKSAESDLKKLEARRKKMQDLIADEERKKRTHNLCGAVDKPKIPRQRLQNMV